MIDASTIGLLLSGLFTLAIFSFLYADNKIYRFVEHIYVGFAIGVSAVMAKASATTTAWIPAVEKGAWIWLLPIAVGLLFCFYFWKKHFWVSRIPVALLVGGGTGLSISGAVKAQVLDQIRGTIGLPILATGSPVTSLNNLLTIIGVASTLLFFFFSRERRGVMGGAMFVGKIFVIVALGAAFGFIIMARMSLLIGRLQFLSQSPVVYLLPGALVVLLIGIWWDRRKARQE